jgi:hypothetical protein
MGAQPSSALGGGNQSLYAALTQQQQMQRPVPSNEFSVSYNFDPVLSKLAALGEQSIANARSEAAALKKQTLIGSGSDKMARELGADENTINAAKQNSFGGAQLLQRDFGDRSRQLDEALNSQNLFFSGERVRQMGDMEFGRAKAETDFGSRLREILSNIDQQLLAAEEQEKMRQIEAEIAAAQNASYVGGLGGPPGGGAAPTPVPPIAPPPAFPEGSFHSLTPGPSPWELAPGQQYVPELGIIPVANPYDEALAAALRGVYPNPVAI